MLKEEEDGELTREVMRAACRLPYEEPVPDFAEPRRAPDQAATVHAALQSHQLSEPSPAQPFVTPGTPRLTLGTPRSLFVSTDVERMAASELVRYCLVNHIELLNKSMVGRLLVWSLCRNNAARMLMCHVYVSHFFHHVGVITK